MSLYPTWWFVIVVLIAAAALAFVAWRRRRPSIRLLVLLGAVLLVALRPVAGDAQQAGRASAVDIIFVVDRTLSMKATDWDGRQERLVGVAHDVRTIVSDNTGARFGMITFDNSARVELPLTTDGTAVATIADTLAPIDRFRGGGSRIDVAVETTTKYLEKVAKKEPGRKRMIIYLGDGEQTVADPPASFEQWRQHTDTVLVLGYGTEQGATMLDNYGEPIPDKNYDDAISRIDEDNLRRIAEQTGGEYEHRTGPDKLSISLPGGLSLSGDEVRGGVELSWIPATAALVVALWELWLAARRHQRLQSQLEPRKEQTR